MECSDQRRHDEEVARAAMEQMSDEALSGMTDMMKEAAKRGPRLVQPDLKIVKRPDDLAPDE